MLVERMLPIALKRLRTIEADGFLPEAAKLLSDTHISLLVVCGADRKMIGVITKTDIVRQIASCQGSLYRIAASAVMTRNVTYCHPGDPLHDVLSKMKMSGFVRIPIVDWDVRPCGVIDARDALQFILRDVEYDISLLRDYVMGVGYR
jgi:CBS domain-containing protein